MKKIFRTTFALAAIAAFASCAEQIDNPAYTPGQDNAGASSSIDFVPMTFYTSSDPEVESKTLYKNRNVYWEETDEISVFSVGSEDVNSKGTVSTIADDRTSVSFTAPADPDAASYYAVYPYSETNACDAEGKLTVNIPSVQTAVVAGFMSGSNTSVAYSLPSAEGNVLQFRNIAALLCISFATDADAAATKSVTIKAKKNDTEYWGLTGTGKVSFDADMNPVIEEGDVQSVTLNAPGGSFVREGSYFIPVYAVGDITGLEVTYTGQDDKQYVKTNSLAATLKRNVLFNIGAIADPYLPEVVPITINFKTSWPFKDPFVVDQVSTGESYAYDYSWSVGNIQFIKTLEFKIRYGCNTNVKESYEHITSRGLLFNSEDGAHTDADYGAIQFPAIQGRYFSSLSATISTEMDPSTEKYLFRRFRLLKDFTPGGAYNSGDGTGAMSGYLRVGASTTYVFELPITSENVPYTANRTDGKGSGNLTSEKNISYCMRMRQVDNCVDSFTIVYTKEQPVLPTASAE